MVPRGIAVALDHLAQLADRGLPHVIGRAATLRFGDLERQSRRVGVGLRQGHALPADVDQALGIAHHERTQRQLEQLAVAQRQVVNSRDAHATGLGVEPGRERAQRVDPPADAVLCLEDDDFVALPFQLVTRHEPGKTTTDDHDPFARTGAPLKSLARDRQHIGGNGRCLVRRRLATRIWAVVSHWQCSISSPIRDRATNLNLVLAGSYSPGG